MFPKKEDISRSGSSPISERLDSWKEIATYLKRDVRTLQRWEKQEGFPVHRLQHGTQGTVFAYKSEIDVWWLNRERNQEQIGLYARLVGTIPARRAASSVVVLLALLGILIGWQFWHVPRMRSELAQRQLTQNSSDNPLDNPVVSRDGMYVAYCDPAGISIEHVDSGETRLIGGTTGFCPQDWFSDGTKLLARGRGAIWTVSLLTSGIRKLLDIEAATAISPDESRIAFVGTMQGIRGIWLTRTDGSHVENVLTTSDQLVAFSWSPSGERFAYIRSPFSSTDAWLESRDLHGKDIRTILEDARLYSSATDAGLVWLPDGRLIFALQEEPPNYRDSNLWGVNVDPHSGRTAGQPHRITNFNGFAWTNLSASRNGNRLVALKVRSILSVYIGALYPSGDRLSSINRLTTDNWSYSIGGWTPDGAGLLLHSRHLGRYQIYRQKLHEHTPEVLFSGAQNYVWPEYSPDKSSILFWANERESFNTRLQLMRLSANAGSPTPVLTASPNASFHCSEASRTCVLRENAEGKAVFSSFDPIQGRGTVLSKVEGSFVDTHSWSLSPDGRSIAYVESPDLRSQTIRVLRLDTGKVSNISLKKFIPEHVAWSQDGRVLFVAGGESYKLGWELVRVRKNGDFTVIDHNPRVIWFPSPSPDGKKLAFAKDTNEFNVAVLENF
jgi:Tol biopolymer transport system component